MNDPCPVPDCKRRISSINMVMCSEHWDRLNEAMQWRVYEHFRPGDPMFMAIVAEAVMTVRFPPPVQTQAAQGQLELF